MKRNLSESEQGQPSSSSRITDNQPQEANEAQMAHEKTQKRIGKRPGRKPSKIDQKAKLERSRQSARECRARKKLRYQYLEELVASREKAVFCLKEELELYKRWCYDLDHGVLPDGLLKMIAQEEIGHPTSTMWQKSPQSQESTPVSSPVGAELREAGRQQYAGQHEQFPASQSVEQFSEQPLTGPSQQHGQYVAPKGHFAGQHRSFQGQVRRTLQNSLVRQPNVTVSGQQNLNTMHKGSRSFEEMSSPVSSSVYRSGSVPNLCAVTTVDSVLMHPAESTVTSAKSFMYVDELGSASSAVHGSDFTAQLLETGAGDESTLYSNAGNVPLVVSHHSPRQARSTLQRHEAWPWNSSPHQTTHDTHSVYSVASTVSSNIKTPSSTITSASLQQTYDIVDVLHQRLSNAGSAFLTASPQNAATVSSNSPSSVVSLSPLCVHSPHSVSSVYGTVEPMAHLRSEAIDINPKQSGSLLQPESVIIGRSCGPAEQPAVSAYQRPRSSSDLAQKVTSTVTSSKAPTSPARLHEPLRGTLSQQARAQSAQDLYSTISQGIATCLTFQTASVNSQTTGTSASASAELSASICEPIPHWYSFLDDLESASILTARQGAHSGAGTPSSSRTRSRPDTPSSGSVDSPYQQSQQIQQQQQQQQQNSGGNIPHIISDLLNDHDC